MFYLPKTQTLDVLGETLEYLCAGQGRRQLVLVNGAGGPLAGWGRLYQALAVRARLLAYNRPGLGRSSPPRVPQTGEHQLESLRALLKLAGWSPPYLLIGHSLGGLLTQLFARCYPDEVEAVLWLDVTAPADVAAQAASQTRLQRMLQRGLNWLSPIHPYDESQHLAATLSAIEQAPAFPPIPLGVLTGSKPAFGWMNPAAVASRAANQRALAQLSPDGIHRYAQASGHFPQLTEPQRVLEVLDEVLVLLEQRQNGGITGS